MTYEIVNEPSTDHGATFSKFSADISWTCSKCGETYNYLWLMLDFDTTMKCGKCGYVEQLEAIRK